MDSLLDDQIQHSTLNDALKELDIQIVRYRMRRSICDQVIKLRCYFLRELYIVCDDGQKWPKKYFHWPFITVKCCLSNFWTNCAILCKVGKISFLRYEFVEMKVAAACFDGLQEALRRRRRRQICIFNNEKQ